MAQQSQGWYADGTNNRTYLNFNMVWSPFPLPPPALFNSVTRGKIKAKEKFVDCQPQLRLQHLRRRR